LQLHNGSKISEFQEIMPGISVRVATQTALRAGKTTYHALNPSEMLTRQH